MIVGSTYLLAGVPVLVLARWHAAPRQPALNGMTSVTPRNVLLELPDGSRTVRSFRGLRKIPPISENPLPDVSKESSRSEP